MTVQRLLSLNRKWPMPSLESCRGYNDVVAPSWLLDFWVRGAKASIADSIPAIPAHAAVVTYLR
jgi:hypothetical protein